MGAMAKVTANDLVLTQGRDGCFTGRASTCKVHRPAASGQGGVMTDFEWIAGVRCACLDAVNREAWTEITSAGAAMGCDSCWRSQSHEAKCPCQGTGKRFPWMWRECPDCQGAGRLFIPKQYGGLGERHGCGGCGGSGVHVGESSREYRQGTGYVLIDTGRETALVRVASVEHLGIKIRPNGDVQVGEYWSALALSFPDSLASALGKALAGKEAPAVVQ